MGSRDGIGGAGRGVVPSMAGPDHWPLAEESYTREHLRFVHCFTQNLIHFSYSLSELRDPRESRVSHENAIDFTLCLSGVTRL